VSEFPWAGLRSGVLCAVLLLPSLVLGQTIQIDGEFFRDPTQPPGTTQSAELIDITSTEAVVAVEVTLNNLSLQFVRSGGINPVAVINSQPLTVGDSIDGATIKEIRPGTVVLDIQGIEHELAIFKRPVRQAIE
jgi:hypothetical protein